MIVVEPKKEEVRKLIANGLWGDRLEVTCKDGLLLISAFVDGTGQTFTIPLNEIKELIGDEKHENTKM